MTGTPIAVFAYNRPQHLKRTLEALSRCSRLDECDVNIFCDGPKDNADRAAVTATVACADNWAAIHHALVLKEKENSGLTRSIVNGVTYLCRDFGRVIVLEDDLIVHPYFLDYMLSSLARYENEQDVFQIAGHMFPVTLSTQEPSILLPFISTWGWATWQRAWTAYDAEMMGSNALKYDTKMRRAFNLNGSYAYFPMLQRQVNGQNDSWGIKWYWSVFKSRGLVLYPRQTLVWNGGFDDSGLHSAGIHGNQPPLASFMSNPLVTYESAPLIRAVDQTSYQEIQAYLKKSSRRMCGARIRRVAKSSDKVRLVLGRLCAFFVIGTLPSRVKVGRGSQLKRSKIQIRHTRGSFIEVGDESNIECRMVLEREHSHIVIGSRSHIGGGTLLDAACSIRIGDDVLVAFDVLIMDHGSHSLRFSEREHDVQDWLVGAKDWTAVKLAPVVIANKAWIGARATILPGIQIGEGAIVAAGSIVTKDVDPWTIVAGNPARLIRVLSIEER